MTALDDCFAFAERRLPHGEAISLLKGLARPVDGTEDVSLFEAVGRIAAGTLEAPRNVPAHTNAAVDGFAFAWADYDPNSGAFLKVAGRAAAGQARIEAEHGMAVRVLTGAIMPAGCDTIAMQEDCRAEGEGDEPRVFIPGGLKRGANVRQAGEDVRAGTPLVQAGDRLRPQDIAALATSGYATVPCRRRPRVLVYSTGNEVIRAGGEFVEGRVFDANAPMLAALLKPLGAIVTDGGVLPDDAEAVSSALAKGAAGHDLIVTSGGASLGEEDHVVKTLRAKGALSLWQLAIKPGRPMGVGLLDDTPVLALPGNPVAVFVCGLLYVCPFIAALSGSEWPEPRRLTLPAAFSIPKRKPGRREFFRGWLERDGDEGQLAVHKYPRDGSGLISSLRAADGLIDVPEDRASIEPGEPVFFIPFSEFGIFPRL